MRIERRGQVTELTPRLQRFIVEALGGVSLDEPGHEEVRRPDYRCLGGLLAIELKSLKGDASERLGNVLRELRSRHDWPDFLGSAPLESFLAHLRDSKKVKFHLIDRVRRPIKNHMVKADDQLAAYESANPRKNSVKIMILVNEDHEIYDPHMVAYITRHLLSRRDKGSLFPHIDAVVFLTERHASVVEGRVAFPIVCIEGESMQDAPWKGSVLDLLAWRWAKWNEAQFHLGPQAKMAFSTIDHIPDEMKRHQQWELEYKRQPYMRNFSYEELRARFDEIVCVSSLAFLQNSPLKPSHDDLQKTLARMSHMMLELGGRGIPISQFCYEPERIAIAATRLGLPSNVVEWFRSDLARAPR